MPIKPLQKTSLVDEVVAALREQIADGHIRPGDTLRIEVLAREFGVSRTPIREAFSKLEVEGLLVRKTGYAATVFTPARREVHEYYEMRLVTGAPRRPARPTEYDAGGRAAPRVAAHQDG